MGYYPIFIEMTERPCIVIGGGIVAERKVQALLNVGATVTVISPDLNGPLHSLVLEGKFKHEARKYQVGDLRGYDLAFAATDDADMNSAIAQEAKEQRSWVNVTDDPFHCDFILPSVLRRGDLVVAVSTGGASPALSKAIREKLEAYLSQDYAELVHVVAEVREELRQRSSSPSSEVWREALGENLLQLLAQGRREEAKAYLLGQLI